MREQFLKAIDYLGSRPEGAQGAWNAVLDGQGLSQRRRYTPSPAHLAGADERSPQGLDLSARDIATARRARREMTFIEHPGQVAGEAVEISLSI
jgi:hypothetical protein